MAVSADHAVAYRGDDCSSGSETCISDQEAAASEMPSKVHSASLPSGQSTTKNPSLDLDQQQPQNKSLLLQPRESAPNLDSFEFTQEASLANAQETMPANDDLPPLPSSPDVAHKQMVASTPRSESKALILPTKLAMRRSDVPSPRKSVMISRSNPEIHHYPLGTHPSSTSSEGSPIESQLNTENRWSPVDHTWESASLNDDLMNSLPAPLPPPRSVSSYEAFLRHNSTKSPKIYDSTYDEEEQEQEAACRDLGISEDNRPRYSYLSDAVSQLDERLHNLHCESPQKINMSIERLSSSINPSPEQFCDDDDSGQTWPARQESGSSDSSHQSLRNRDRSLTSSPVRYNMGHGTQLNEGVRGLTDAEAAALMPLQPVPVRSPSTHQYLHDLNSTYKSTEESIMQMLGQPASFADHIKKEPQSMPKIKQEHQAFIEPLVFIKQEEGDSSETLFKEEIAGEDSPVLNLKFESKHEQVLPATINLKHERTDILLGASCSSPINDDGSHPYKLLPGKVGSMSGWPKNVPSFDTLFSQVQTVMESVSDIGKTGTPKLISTSSQEGSEHSEDNLMAMPPGQHSFDGHRVDENDEDDDGGEYHDTWHLSIRFETDSAWKLEHSNDGDREDNDDDRTDEEDDVTATDILPGLNIAISDPRHETRDNLFALSPKGTDIKVEDMEDTEILDSLTPTINGAESFAAERETSILDPGLPNRMRAQHRPGLIGILANSSNIANSDPEYSLPPLEPGHYSSLEDVTRGSQRNSYEEILSAEHDKVPSRPLDFKDIWHQQATSKKQQLPSKPAAKVYVLDRAPNPAAQKIPATLRPKGFREVHVTSRRILSPDMIDYSVSNFLPELSQDSGFENQFKFLARTSSTYHDLNNVLDELQPANAPKSRRVSSRTLADYTAHRQRLQPQSRRSSGTTLVKSPRSPAQPRFSAPRIERCNSRLSPRNGNSPVFETFIPQPPTIRSNGMKTLPSMERDDLKRIMDSKRNLTQIEYKNLKLQKHGGAKEIQVEPSPNDVLLEASLHVGDSDLAANADYNAPYIVADPVPLMPDQALFGEMDSPDLVRNGDGKVNGAKSVAPGGKSNGGKKTKTSDWTSALKELKQSVSANVDYVSRRKSSLDINNAVAAHHISSQQADKSNRKSQPIKIGSPLKLVKDGDRYKVVVPTSPVPPPRRRHSTDLASDLARTKPRHKLHTLAKSPPLPSPGLGKRASSGTSVIHSSASAASKKISLPTLIPADRGRLFFRIMGLKNVALPDIESHNAQVSFSLDNGVHCIKTQNYEMQHPHVGVEKEFELTVEQNLEFIVTAKCTWPKPAPSYREVKSTRKVKSRNRLSRLFGGKEIVTTTEVLPFTPVDTWENKFANDGSFARCYIDLSQFEHGICGRVSTFDVPCFNEWEQDAGGKLAKCPPRVGLLEVKMLFVPRTNALEQLPTSIRNAHEALERLRVQSPSPCTGYLYQEGGDCPAWKRRFFKLEGSSLIAHLEYTHKTRAKINLCKVVEVKYLNQEKSEQQPHQQQKRRDFSDVMLMENSFRIKFADGETIEFGATSRSEMATWTNQFEEIVSRNALLRQPWVKLMIEAGSV